MTSCPCCGSSVDRPVIVSLDCNTVATAKAWARMTPKAAEIFSTLWNAFPATVTVDDLGVSILGSGYFSHSRNLLRVHVAMTRKAIAPLGFDIERAGKRGAGYRLSTSKTEGA